MGEYADDLIDAGFDSYEGAPAYSRDWRPNDFTPEFLWRCVELTDFEIVHETDKALLIKCEAGEEYHQFWLPKSQACDYRGKSYINEWFAEKIASGKQKIEKIPKDNIDEIIRDLQ